MDRTETCAERWRVLAVACWRECDRLSASDVMADSSRNG